MADYIKYIKSENIKTFPAAGRSENYSQSYLLSEKNLTETIRSLYQKNNSSFIISETFSAPFKFVIDGRYFEIDNITGLNNTGDLFATIFVNKETQRVAGYDENNIVSKFIDNILDNNSSFIGVYFSPTIPADDPTNTYIKYSLQILKQGKLNTDALIHLVTGLTIDNDERTLIIGDINSR